MVWEFLRDASATTKWSMGTNLSSDDDFQSSKMDGSGAVDSIDIEVLANHRASLT